MANANASSPGVNATAGKLEINIAKDEQIVRKKDGRLVRRTEFQTGTVRETEVFKGDFKDNADIIDEADLGKEDKKKESK